MVADGENTSRAATTASIDRRVERLEDAVQGLKDSYSAMDKKIDHLDHGQQTAALSQQHLKDIVDAKFAGLQMQNEAQSTKLDSLIGKVDSLSTNIQSREIESQRYMSDPLATPAGKALIERADDNKSRIDSLEKKILPIFYIVGFLSVVIVPILTILGPAIRQFLHLP